MTGLPELAAAVSAHARGSTLALIVAPRASVNRLEPRDDGTLRVRLTAPPIDGAANAALMTFLARVLDVPRSRLSIAAGESSRRKRILVAGVPPEDLVPRLQAALGRGGSP